MLVTAALVAQASVCMLVRSEASAVNTYIAIMENRAFSEAASVRMRTLWASSTRGFLEMAFSPEYADCDIFVGPGASVTTVQLNPALPRLQLEFGAAALDLDDRVTFPYFARLVPRAYTQGRALVEFIQTLGYSTFSVLVSTDSYGAGMAEMVETRARELGMTVWRTYSFSSTNVTEVQAVVTAASRAPTRVVAAVFTLTTLSGQAVMPLLNSSGMSRRNVLVFSASMCGNAQALAYLVPRSLCVTNWYDPAALAASEQRARNATLPDAAWARGVMAAGAWNVTEPSLVASSSSTPLAVDAARMAIMALVAARTRRVRSWNDTAMYALLLDASFVGMSGPVGLGGDGNRLDPAMLALNLLGDARAAIVARQAYGGVWEATAPIAYVTGGAAPSEFLFSPSPPGVNVTVIVSAVAGALVVVIVAVAGGVVWWQRRGRRDNRNAPRDPTGVALLFTDIEASTALWAAAPREMAEALDAHNHVVRRCAAQHRAYEVKTIGDSFMLAFASPAAAVTFALDMQDAMLAHHWPAAIDAEYDAIAARAPPTPGQAANDAALWRGLRVRVGVHFGPVEVREDAVTKGVDYFGAVVNEAARLEACARGGQVIASLDLWGACEQQAVGGDPTARRLLMTASVGDLGTHTLRGVGRELRLLQISRGVLVARRFGPLRLDHAGDGRASAKLPELELCPAPPDGGGDVPPTPTMQAAPESSTDASSRAASGHVLGIALTPLPPHERTAFLRRLAAAWRLEWRRGGGADAGGEVDFATNLAQLAGRIGPVYRRKMLGRALPCGDHPVELHGCCEEHPPVHPA